MWPVLIGPAGKHGDRTLMVPGMLPGSGMEERLFAVARTGGAGPDGRPVPHTFRGPDGNEYTLLLRQVRAYTDGTARLWDARTGQIQATLAGHGSHISGVAFAPDGRSAATASWDQTVQLWDVATGAVNAKIISRAAGFSGCRFTPDGRSVVTTGFDGTVGSFDARTGAPRTTARLPVPLTGAAALNASGRILYAAGADHAVHGVHLLSGKIVGPLAGHTDAITACALSPNGRLLSTASRDNSIIIWDLRRLTKVMKLSGHTDWATGCAFSADGSWLASTGWDGTLRRWDLRGRDMRILATDGNPLRALALSANDLAAATAPGRILICDAQERAKQTTFGGLAGWTGAIAWSPDARLILTGSQNDDPTSQNTVKDGYGRPAVFTEGIVLPGQQARISLGAKDWSRLHAVCLEALALAAADRTGRLVVRSSPLPAPADRRGPAAEPPSTTDPQPPHNQAKDGCLATAIVLLGGLIEVSSLLAAGVF